MVAAMILNYRARLVTAKSDDTKTNPKQAIGKDLNQVEDWAQKELKRQGLRRGWRYTKQRKRWTTPYTAKAGQSPGSQSKDST